MGDDDDGAAEIARGVSSNQSDRGQVEVVGRLVEQQHVGPREQQLRQLDAHQPAAAEARERPGRAFVVEAEPREHARDTRASRSKPPPAR